MVVTFLSVISIPPEGDEVIKSIFEFASSFVTRETLGTRERFDREGTRG